MKILFVCNEYPPARAGGIGVFVHNLGRALVAAKQEVFVLGMGAKNETWEDEGVRVRTIAEVTTGNSHLRVIRNQWRLSRAVRAYAVANKIDLIECPDYRGAAALLNFPKPLGVPVVVRLHGTTTAFRAVLSRKSSRLMTWLESAGLEVASHRVGVSKYIAEETCKVFPKVKFVDEVIPNFTNSKDFNSVPRVERDPNLVLFVGKISRNKGMPELFASLPILFQHHPTMRLRVVGGDTKEGSNGGSLKEELLAGLSDLYHGRITFTGHIPHEELAALYRKAAVCVFPSRVEAMCLVVLEAMASARAVVVSRSECFREVVADGVTGFVADTSNPEELAQKIGRLLENPTLADRLGRAARDEVMAKFDLPVAVVRNLEFYRGCVEGD